MSCSKPLPPFTYDVLRYLNRNQLERFLIVCRSLKNFIDRYYHSKPYRIFDELEIRGGLYTLHHNNVQWHPNQEEYSVQQFLAGQICSIDKTKAWADRIFYSFAEMRPYLVPTVRIEETTIHVASGFYNLEHVAEMESIAYLWRNGDIEICNAGSDRSRIMSAEDFQPILNSPIILQCHTLDLDNAHFSFKDYNVLYTVNVIETQFYSRNEELQNWQQFLEKPGVKPVVVFYYLRRENIDNLLNQLSKTFSSAVSPNAFKVVFVRRDQPLTKFRETNNTSREKLELKKGLPPEYQNKYLEKYDNYTLERSDI